MSGSTARLMAALAGLGAAAGGAATVAVAGVPAAGGLALAATRAAAPTSTSATATAPSRPRCDDGAWRLADRLSAQGRPEGVDRGDRGATYLWHDNDGWHLRATDPHATESDYTGTIRSSPGASFSDVHTVRLEKDDRVTVDGDNVLHYSFSTYNGIDGVDFRVSACDGARAHEVLSFALSRNGGDEDATRIDIGAEKAHPDRARFDAVRSA